jgi:hypothetical protein
MKVVNQVKVLMQKNFEDLKLIKLLLKIKQSFLKKNIIILL